MDDKTRAALEGSIAKWEAIVAGTGEDNGSLNCDLCKRFHARGCLDCPVFLKTHAITCAETPYVEWSLHHQNVYDQFMLPLQVTCDECRVIAQREVDFLKGLRDAD